MSGVRRATLRDEQAFRACMRKAGVSEVQASRRAGLPDDVVPDLLAGRRGTCSLGDARVLAQALGCRFDDLFTAA